MGSASRSRTRMEPASTSVSEDNEGGAVLGLARLSARSSGHTCTAYIHSFGFVWRGRGAAGVLRQMWDGLLGDRRPSHPRPACACFPGPRRIGVYLCTLSLVGSCECH